MRVKINYGQRLFASKLENLLKHAPKHLDPNLRDKVGSTHLGAWFLGPKAENEALITPLIVRAIESHCADRRAYFPTDPPYVTPDMQNSPDFQQSFGVLQTQFEGLLEKLSGSVPFWSYRYQAHMNWDITVPSMLGFFGTMLYNPNNVAAESSPVTTPLEIEVGNDLCEMLGYATSSSTASPDPSEISPWGHITCDGSVANIESIWAARNLKFYPVAVAEALVAEPQLSAARYLTVSVCGRRKVLADLDRWTLLNLHIEEILDLPRRIHDDYGVEQEALSDILANYSIQSLGYSDFRNRFLKDLTLEPAIIAPSTMHYSWPKGAALVGIGSDNVITVDVDLDARMNMAKLRTELDKCLAQKRPVFMVVAVIGSTAESAVDPLSEIVTLRDEYRSAGLEFVVHADAAWGGYFASMLREPAETGVTRSRFTPELIMSKYVISQYQALKFADSITLDPHKAGYCNYPAGALCYRNSAMRNLVSFTSPVVYHGGIDPTVGVYGVEGSKPGAAAAGVWLSHRVIRTDQSGYGKLLGECLYNSKRLYAAIATLNLPEDPFTVTMVNRLPAEKAEKSLTELAAQLAFIRERIVPKSNEDLIADNEAMELLKELGSDQIIVAYAFNLKVNSQLNEDPLLANKLNLAVYRHLSLAVDTPGRKPRMIVTQSSFGQEDYGVEFVSSFQKRLGTKGGAVAPIDFLISTTMDPWLTATDSGSMIPELMIALRETILDSIDEILE